jgi:hypothetical protein
MSGPIIEAATPQTPAPLLDLSAAPQKTAPANTGAGHRFDGAPVSHMEPVRGWDTKKLIEWKDGASKAKDELTVKAKDLVEGVFDVASGALPASELPERRLRVAEAERKLSASIGDTAPLELEQTARQSYDDLNKAARSAFVHNEGKRSIEVATCANRLLVAATALKASVEARHEPTGTAELYISTANDYLSLDTTVLTNHDR